jgi:hypothetical protein
LVQFIYCFFLIIIIIIINVMQILDL